MVVIAVLRNVKKNLFFWKMDTSDIFDTVMSQNVSFTAYFICNIFWLMLSVMACYSENQSEDESHTVIHTIDGCLKFVF